MPSFPLLVLHRQIVQLLGNYRVDLIDWLRVVVQRRCLAQNNESAYDGGHGEQPQEQSVHDHRHEAPILVLLRFRQRR